jgi:hypothetical protein
VTDNYDTAIQSKLVISGSVNTNVVGTYYVYYNATDAEGNPADEVMRTVIVGDGEAPVIVLTGANPQYIEVKTPYIEQGASVSDNYDTNLTATIDTGNVNTNVTGTYYVYYTAKDSNNNRAQTGVRTVIVRDTTIPVITLSGSAAITLEVHTAYTEFGATVTDNYDTAIQSRLLISGSVDTGTVGTYYVYYNATDADGNPADEVMRTINVVDTTIPLITLSGANPQYREVNTSYIELGAVVTDNYDTNLTATINTGNVNMNQTGSYTVYYNVTDTHGNQAIQKTRTVIVRDTTAPVLSLNGSGVVTIEGGSSFVDAGADRSDNYDGT